MNLDDWVEADPRRQPRAAHRWFGTEWTGADPQTTYGVGWSPATGELYAVDEVGGVEVLAVLDAGQLGAALRGWEAAQGLPGSLLWLRVACDPAMRARLAREALSSELRQSGVEFRPTKAAPSDVTEVHEALVRRRAEIDAALGRTGPAPEDASRPLPALGDVVQRAPGLAYEEWLAVNPDRVTAHRDLGHGWRGEADEAPRRLAWVPTTGELYLTERLEGGRDGVVEVVAVIPDERELEARLDGWQAEAGAPGGLYWLRAAAADVTGAEPSAGQTGLGWDFDLPAAMDPPRARDRVVVADTGEEARAAMVEAWATAREESRTALMVAVEDRDVADLNRRARALLVGRGLVDEEGMVVDGRQFGRGDEVLCLRTDDRLGVASGATGKAVAVDAEARTITVAIAGGEGWVVLPGWYLEEGHLAHAYATTPRQAQGLTIDQAFMLGEDLHRDVGPAWSLPAGPVARVIRQIQVETGHSVLTAAVGLNLDPEWAAGVVAGEVEDVDLAHVEQVCESLRCSPYDLWGEEDAERILHAYGPERWPEHMEPLGVPYVGNGPDLAELSQFGPDFAMGMDL